MRIRRIVDERGGGNGLMRSVRLLFLLISLMCMFFITPTQAANADTILPLQVEGQKIFEGQPVRYDSHGIISSTIFNPRGVNFNLYMEYAYESTANVTIDDFHRRIAWSITQEDYNRIKTWGFNTVRLNISYKNIRGNNTNDIDQTAFDNLKDNVRWAKEAGIYTIIAYFAPQGSVASTGYYSDVAFWNAINNGGTVNTNVTEFVKYKHDWEQIVDQFKDEPHVIFELLNEPQIKDDDQLSGVVIGPYRGLYVDFLKQTIGAIRARERVPGIKHLIIADAMNYAQVDPTYSRFISDMRNPDNSNFDTNIAYSFHYYKPESFVFSGCNWYSSSCTNNRDSVQRLNLNRSDLGWQSISIAINRNTSPLLYSYLDSHSSGNSSTSPFLEIASWSQPGTYYIKDIMLTDNTDRTVFSENFINKHADNNVDNNSTTGGRLDDVYAPCRSWSTVSNGQHRSTWGSTIGSSTGLEVIDAVQVLKISNTIPGILDNSSIGRWASTALNVYQWSTGCPSNTPPIMLNKDHVYTLTLNVKGSGLASFGGLDVKIAAYPATDQYAALFTYSISVDTMHNNKLVSDYNMISADIRQMKMVSDTLNVPMFVGEIGIPERNYCERAGNTSTACQNERKEYFKNLTKILENAGFGWTIFEYREPLDKAHSSDRTLGLYSGWGISVSDMEKAGLGTDIDNSDYYYMGYLIDYFKETYCSPLLSTGSTYMTSTGGPGSVGITSNGISVTSSGVSSGCTWTAVSNNGWISITSGANGTGNGTVNYSVSANTASTSRTGTITIGGQTYTITQSGACNYNLSSTGASLSSVSGNGSVSVIAAGGCSWTAVSNNTDWLTIASGSSGAGNGAIGYYVSANTTSASRIGTITVGGKIFKVTQDGACSYSLSPTGASSSSGSGSISVTTGSGCSWTATSNNGWVSITSGASGTGSGTVNYTVRGNTHTTSRTGTITIGGRTFTLTQQPTN